MHLIRIIFSDYYGSSITIVTNIPMFDISDYYQKGTKILGKNLFKESRKDKNLYLSKEDLKNLIDHGFLEKNKEWSLDSDTILYASEEYVDVFMFVVWLGNNDVTYEYRYIDEMSL